MASGTHDDDSSEHDLFRTSAPASMDGGFEAVPRSDKGSVLPEAPRSVHLPPVAEPEDEPSGFEDEGFDIPIETTAIPADAPHQLGRYKLHGLIGKGGMAEVYLAHQDGPAGFSKACVVKRIRRSLAEEAKFVEMFLREARIAAKLNHPNVVQLFELGHDGVEYFIAMEFLDGVSLHRAAKRTWAKGGAFPMEVILRAIADAALGLHHAHTLTGPGGKQMPLVHRDVSPDNIMLTRDGVSKVLDFGIAKSSDIEEQTGTGEVKGKIPFMSPEQLQSLPLDGRSDLWSLGITLYWLLTSQRPFDASNTPMTIDAIMRRAPRSTRELNPHVPQAVDAIVMQLLEKDPAHRFANAAELADRLLALLGPSSGYTQSAAFASLAMGWGDVDGAPALAPTTAAMPVSQWLKRADQGIPDFALASPAVTPPPASTMLMPERESTAKTITGVKTALSDTHELPPVPASMEGRPSRPPDAPAHPPEDDLMREAMPRVWPIAAAVVLIVAVIVGVVYSKRHDAPEEAAPPAAAP